MLILCPLIRDDPLHLRYPRSILPFDLLFQYRENGRADQDVAYASKR